MVSALLTNAAVGFFSIVFLVAAAELVVKKMEGVAKHYGISEVVIAVTIISIGTSLPEITLHLVGSVKILMSSGVFFESLGSSIPMFLVEPFSQVASSLAEQGVISEQASSEALDVYRQQSGTVVGASIGSDVVQETLVIGLVIISSALLAGKHSFKFSRKFLIRNYAPMVGTSFITLFLALNWEGLIGFFLGGPLQVSGVLTRLDGFILVGSFVAYMYYIYTTRGEKLAEQGDVSASERPVIDLLIGLGAMGVVIVSADFFLSVVEVFVRETGLSGSMIGVATVGVVSAFPEMITAISGLRHGSEGVSLGTLVGSNITNPLLAIGSGAALSTYTVPRPLVLWDLPMEIFLAGLPVGYMYVRSDIGDLISKPFYRLGLSSTARKLESAENRKLSIAGAVVLIALYFFYIYVRFNYFQYDFVGGA